MKMNYITIYYLNYQYDNIYPVQIVLFQILNGAIDVLVL